MKYTVIIDPGAKTDLKELYLFVAINDGVQAANKLLDALEETCYKLEEYPERGHIPPELIPTGIKNYLKLHYKSYRIIYEIDKKEVYVHLVIDGRRNVQDILSQRLLR
ncbi:MAG: type II toxin-antitoxin system RelE/ParE family toxin [Ignavibacteriaceae bacterium]